MPSPSSGSLDAFGVAGAVACCALWGGNAVAVKFAVPDLPPIGCAALRFLIGIPFLALVCLRARQPLWVPPGQWGLAIANAALTVAQIGSFNWGTNLSLAGRASVLINIHPLVVAPLAAVFLHEHLGRRGRLGLTSAALGVGVLLMSSYFARGRSIGPGLVGDLVVVASGVIFGIQTIVQKKTFPHIPPATLLFVQSVLALPLFLGLSLTFEGVGSYRFTKPAVWGLLYQAVVALGICYSLWLWLLRHYPVGRLSTVAFLTPLFGIGFSRLLQGEPLSLPLLCAAGAVGLGIYLVASDRSAAYRVDRPSGADTIVPTGRGAP